MSRDSFVPDGLALPEALARTTHLGIVAHADDLEILAFAGILACYRKPDRWFTGIVVTDGAGSSRSEEYAKVGDAEFLRIRVAEQRRAAALGAYAAVIQLGRTSAEAKGAGRAGIVEELLELLKQARPEVVYTHNPADRHDTHVAASLAALEACRRLPAAERPRRLLGGEVWRDLDWLCDEDKVAEDVSGRDHFASALIGTFDSQIAGAKRYDLAVMGRRQANATYSRSHAVDRSSALAVAMDLTPLLVDPSRNVFAHVDAQIGRFRDDVKDRLGRLSGRPGMSGLLTGRSAVVIGATSGIGRALAKGLAAAGADVAPTGRREAKVAEVAGEIEALGRKSLRVASDVGSRASLESLLGAATKAFGQVDILVNCAGKTGRTPTLDLSEAQWNDILETNLTGMLRACQVFGRPMLERGYGRIVNIASLASFVALHEVAAYNVSKAGVAALTKTLAVEWAARGVCVNAIAPGVFRTELNQALLDGTPRGQEFLARTPMKRFGKVEELVGAAVFLASEGASFVTGTILAVDGGFLASGVNQ